MNNPEFSVIIESYNLSEGGAKGIFIEVLDKIVSIVADSGNGELIVIDVDNSINLAQLLQKHSMIVKCVSAHGMGYDSAKHRAVQEASGEFVIFLDGDCVPQSGWLDTMLQALRKKDFVACGGYTYYAGGYLSRLMSIMDFGFFYPVESRPLQCYASNNVGFQRGAYLETPVVTENLRCGCFRHAQTLLDRGTPVQLVPEAKVLHEEQSVITERTRQGYDAVVSAWNNPNLAEALWLRCGGILSVFPLYAMNIFLDWKRATLGRGSVGFSKPEYILSLFLFPMFRLLDSVGMLYAIVRGAIPGGWEGMRLPWAK